MKRWKKMILACVIVLAAGFLGYQAYLFVHYNLYDGYKEYLKENEVEEGTEFRALADSDPRVEGMVLAAENDRLKLYTDTGTAEVAVYDKRTGEVTYSNPADAEQDTLATGVNQSMLRSQLIVEYYNANRLAGTYNSYDYATSLGQFELEALEDGIRYTYTLGDLSSETGIVPVYITEERLREFTDKLEEKEAKYILNKYFDSKTAAGSKELTENALKGAATLRKLNIYFEHAGYTAADYEADMAAAGAEGAVPICFQVPLEYRLSEDSLVVSVPTGLIEETGGAKIYRLQILRYFGAAGTEENGYIMVPNGAGSLIYFNNGKTTAEDYNQYVYGIDPLSAGDDSAVEHSEPQRLPVFGMKKEAGSLFASIESGETLAMISASVAGKVNSYNYVYPSFVLRGYDKLSMFGSTGNEADLPVLETDFYDVDLCIRYSFLTEEYGSYSGMANYYREKLAADGLLTAKEPKASIPFYMDVIGAVKQTKFFLGAQYKGTAAMTTFEQAQEMVDTLTEAGISNQVVNYQGWFNGGYYHDVPDRIKLSGILGSRKEFEALSAGLKAQGGKLYGDVAFQKVTYLSKRYKYMKESSRYYAGGYVAVVGQINPTTLTNTSSLGYRETLSNLMSPKFLPRYVSRFASEIQGYGITGISLRDLGDNLQSDKKRTEVVNREEAKQIVAAQLECLEKTGKELMMSSANAYALPYADDLINVPLSDNDYYIVDEEIPFYQMVLHGYLNYAGTAVNLGDTFDRTEILLGLLEYGASPHFTFTYEDATEMKYTGLNRFYSTTFEYWKQDAADLYREVNEVLKDVSGSAMVKHEILAGGVRKITYGNGVILYINRSQADAEADGITIPAGSYRKGGAIG